jgi:hypothetical protein
VRKVKSLDINTLSPHLFWDVDRSQVDVNKNLSFLVARVLQYGRIDDWRIIYRNVGLERITEVAKEIKGLDDRSMHFIANLTDTPIEKFLCYKLKQSIPPHWNF